MEICAKGVLPWNSPYADQKPRRIHGDSQEEIEKCISCDKAECDNCLAEFDKKYGSGRKIPIEDLRVFLRAYTQSDAAEHFGCSRTTIWRLLHNDEK